MNQTNDTILNIHLLNEFSQEHPESLDEFLESNKTYFENIIAQLGSPHYKEDILQEIRMVLLEQPPVKLFNADNKIGLITQIIKYKAIDYYRQNIQRYQTDVLSTWKDYALTPDETRKVFNMELGEFEQLLQQAMHVLDDFQKTVFKISYQFGVGLTDFKQLGVKDIIATYIIINIFALNDDNLKDKLIAKDLYHAHIKASYIQDIENNNMLPILKELNLTPENKESIRNKIRVIRQKIGRDLAREILRLINKE